MEICNFKTCKKPATTKGHIYGHIRGEENKTDRLLEVVACDEHAKNELFYPEKNEKL